MNKKQKEVKQLVEKRAYTIDEAMELLPQVSTSKFPGSAELVINLKLSEKQKKQPPVRGSVVFTNSFGEQAKVLVFTEEADKALKAGADYAGLDDYAKKIEEGWEDFTIVIATPQTMPMIARLGKYLGRKGLMPNPKNGTVTTDIEAAIKMYKSGKKDFKANDQDSIRIVFGKLNMSPEQLKQNFEDVRKSIGAEVNKYGKDVIKGMFVSPTMGPSIKLENTL